MTVRHSGGCETIRRAPRHARDESTDEAARYRAHSSVWVQVRAERVAAHGEADDEAGALRRVHATLYADTRPTTASMAAHGHGRDGVPPRGCCSSSGLPALR